MWWEKAEKQYEAYLSQNRRVMAILAKWRSGEAQEHIKGAVRGKTACYWYVHEDEVLFAISFGDELHEFTPEDNTTSTFSDTFQIHRYAEASIPTSDGKLFISVHPNQIKKVAADLGICFSAEGIATAMTLHKGLAYMLHETLSAVDEWRDRQGIQEEE